MRRLTRGRTEVHPCPATIPGGCRRLAISETRHGASDKRRLRQSGLAPKLGARILRSKQGS